MAVPYTFGTATASIPLSQLDSNFATVITLGNTAIQLGNTVTTLNNMTLANVTISSGNVTLTNVAVTTANVTTANITTAVIGTETVTTSTITTANVTTANITTANITTDNITSGTVSTSLTLSYGTANAVAYLNGSKVVTTGSALTFDGTNFATTGTATATKLIPTGTSVTGNGMYLPATNAVGISTNGTNAVYIDSSQNVGIGTSSPAVKLDVSGQLNAQNFTSASTFGFKNRIINGGMVIDQRNAGASVSASADSTSYFAVDRTSVTKANAGVITIQQSTVAPAGFSNSLKALVATADAAVAAGDFAVITQAIEGYNTADFGFGASGASTVILSFWVRSSLTGTYCTSLVNSAGTRSYVTNYTINAANTWEQKTITVAGDTAGTWVGATNGTGLLVRFGLMAGTSFQQTAGSWGTANAMGSSSQVNWMATLSNDFYITGVQLEKGSTATTFDYRPYGTELVLCQRYYEVCYLALSGTSLWTPGATIPFAVTKRTTPTMTYLSTISNSNFTLPNSFADIQIYAATGYATATSATNCYARTLNSASAEL